MPVQSIPTAAALAGWRRAERWLIGHDGRRKHRVVYAPPGREVPESAPRGRPETNIYTMLNRHLPSPFDVTDASLADGKAIPSNAVALGAHSRAVHA